MILMILQMTAATALYILLTVILWRFWNRKTEHSVWMKLSVGLFYGICSIVSNHISINYGDMLLNVRDIGPLAAGLFFGPISGIVSGLIGGVERYIVGEYFGIGSFTRLACAISTCLAGFFSAILYKSGYKGRRPSVPHAFFIGAVMEVFHMYAVLITHRDDMYAAYAVIQACGLPMIIFTGLGLAACSGIILCISGKKEAVYLWTPREKTPVHVRFQRWLFVVTIALFAVSTILTNSFQAQARYQNTVAALELERDILERRFEHGLSLDELQSQMNEDYFTSGIECYRIDVNNSTIAAWDDIDSPHSLEASMLSEIIRKAGGEVYRSVVNYSGLTACFCASARMDHQYYLLLCIPVSTVNEDMDRTYENLFSEIIIFTTLYMMIAVLVDNMVVRNLKRVNKSLQRITNGDLREIVEVRDSSEFTELSDDINQTVTALRGYIDAEKKRMEKDLKLATMIQESALPKVFSVPDRHDFEIYALMNPAKQVGGDFYDFFFIDHDRLALVIADVSGKSIPAALFMMRAKTAIKNFARSGNSPAELLYNVNNTLCEGNEAEMFVTVWIGIVHLSDGTVQCANAGHEFPLLMRAGGEYELLRDKHSLPLAAMENAKMKEYELKLQPGDQLLVYTDGIPEAINEKEEAYGTERLQKKANEVRRQNQQLILESIFLDVEQFAGKAEQFDDITMIGFTYLGPGGKPESNNSDRERSTPEKGENDAQG